MMNINYPQIVQREGNEGWEREEEGDKTSELSFRDRWPW